jgi:tetratricopeptide (TPR) repeat protein
MADDRSKENEHEPGGEEGDVPAAPEGDRGRAPRGRWLDSLIERLDESAGAAPPPEDLPSPEPEPEPEPEQSTGPQWNAELSDIADVEEIELQEIEEEPSLTGPPPPLSCGLIELEAASGEEAYPPLTDEAEDEDEDRTKVERPSPQLIMDTIDDAEGTPAEPSEPELIPVAEPELIPVAEPEPDPVPTEPLPPAETPAETPARALFPETRQAAAVERGGEDREAAAEEATIPRVHLDALQAIEAIRAKAEEETSATALDHPPTEQAPEEAESPPPTVRSEETTPSPGEVSPPAEQAREAEEVGPRSPLDEAMLLAAEDDPHRIEVALTQELEAEEDRHRKAILQYELGHLTHRRLESEARAVKAYAQALNYDPLLRPNVWAIRRIFVTRKLWPNLLKLHDAEVRFEEDPRRKAEILLEKGWILEDKLHDLEAATECFWAAHAAHGSWLAPLLALERLALAAGDLGALADVYRRLADASTDPGRQVAILIDLARLQEKLIHGTPQTALGILEEAYLIGPDRLRVLEHMQHVAASAGLHRELVDALRRQSDVLLALPEADRRGAMARLRTAALVARDELKDPVQAHAILTAAAQIAPEERVIQMDLLGAAEEREDWVTVERLLLARLETTTDRVARAALCHRIGFAQLAAGSPSAAETMQRALEQVPGYLPVLVDQERTALAQGDLDALAHLWVTEAEAVEQRSVGLPLGDEGDPAWCAATLWRASYLLHRRLAEPERAIELCRRALRIRPDFAPAQEELEEILRRTGKHGELAGLWEQQLAAAPKASGAENRLESLLALYAGPLEDPDRLLGALKRLAQIRPDDRRLGRRIVEVLDRLGRHDELETALRSVEGLEQQDEQRATWQLWRAHLYQGPLKQPDVAVATYWEILDRLPENAFAFAQLEGLLHRQGRHEDLAKLLRRAADQCPPTTEGDNHRVDVLRSLALVYDRYLERPEEAIAVYSELLALRPRDPGALREMARAAMSAADAAKLAETLESQAEALAPGPSQARAYLQLAEVLDHDLSDPERAEEMMLKAVDASPEKGAVIDALEFLARRALVRGDHSGTARWLETMENEAPAGTSSLILEERAWITGGPLAETEQAQELWSQVLAEDPQNRRATFARWRLAARQRDTARIAEAASRLAELAVEQKTAAVLDMRAGTLGEAQKEPAEQESAEAFRRALRQVPGAAEALLGLLARDDLEPDERADLYKRLADIAPDRVREEMRLPLAESLERAGRFQEAIAELTPVLEKDPDLLPALVIAERIASAVGDREQEAHCLVKIGTLTSERAAKTESFARAADLFQDLSRREEAAVLCSHVLALRPTEQQAYERLRQLYQEDHNTQGLAQLLGHRIRHTEDSGNRIALHFERAQLRLHKLQDRQGAARDLLQILHLEPKHLEALRQLSRLYDEDNNPARAVQLYQRYAAATELLPLKRPAVLRMAELLHEKLGRTGEAVDVCRRLLEISPDDENVLEQLAELYVHLRDFPHAVGMLERLGGLRQDRTWKAHNLRRIAALYWKDMRDPSDARNTLLRAREEDPTNIEIVRDLRQVCRELSAEAEVGTLLDRAMEDLREGLALQPLSVDLFRKLMQVSEWAEDEYTLLASMGALCYLNAAGTEDRDLYSRRVSKITFEPRHQLGAQAWREALTDRGAKNACGGIWDLIAEVVPRLFEGRVRGDPAAFGIRRGAKVDRKLEGSVSATLDRIAGAFGLADFDIYRSRERDVVDGFVGDRLGLVVDSSVVATLDATRRFRIGRTLSLLRDRAIALEVLNRAEVELLVAATIFLGDPGVRSAIPRAEVEAEARRVAKVLPRKSKRALPLAVQRCVQEGADLDSWIDGVIATANRAGLLVCGDVAVAMDQLLRPAPSRVGRTTAQIVAMVEKNQQAAQLLVFSVSREYVGLRRELRV